MFKEGSEPENKPTAFNVPLIWFLDQKLNSMSGSLSSPIQLY